MKIILSSKTLKILHNELRIAQKLNNLKLYQIVMCLLLINEQENFSNISKLLNISERTVYNWLGKFVIEGFAWLVYYHYKGKTGKQKGCRPKLGNGEKKKLANILRQSPKKYGFDSDSWNNKMIAEIIKRKFGVKYNPGYISTLLARSGIKIQRGKSVSNCSGGQKRKTGKKESEKPKISEELKDAVIKTANEMKGRERRIFMARIVISLGQGGQRIAERDFGWNRGTVRKGLRELKDGFAQTDRYSDRGRKKSEEHLPGLREDIKDIVEPLSQADPTFRTTQLYSPITAEEVHKRLREDKGYTDDELPTPRTVSTILNDMKYFPQKVAKTKPVKKIKETDAIFEQIHKVNKDADETEGVIRISGDSKAKVKVGPFSGGGRNRTGVKGVDHDHKPVTVMTPFGFFLPAFGETFIDFTESRVTADFTADSLERLWPLLNRRFNPHTVVINLDNGSDNNSHRTQFIKRMVEFAQRYNVTVRLAYYPPYHSKYNPIERVWGVLENHWKGELLYSVEKVPGLARTMKWNGKNPTVNLIKGVYNKGVRLSKKVMKNYEAVIQRLPGLEKWFVDIPPQSKASPS